MSSTRMVTRDDAASVEVCAIVVPSSFRKSIEIGTASPFGFAIRISVSKNDPVAPSER